MLNLLQCESSIRQKNEFDNLPGSVSLSRLVEIRCHCFALRAFECLLLPLVLSVVFFFDNSFQLPSRV